MSPLVLGLLHLLPSVLILAAVGLAIFSLQKTSDEQKVLGVKTSLEFVKTETREDRIKALEKSYRETESLEVKGQLDRLR